MLPSLTVIIPVYNRTALLVHPLRSLREAAAATPDLQWEIVVVDDGSTEDVASVLASFSDLPIRLHRQENKGLLAARLTGLSLAQHEAVLFLDGDDLVAPGKFTAQLPALTGADVTYGDVGRVDLEDHGQLAGALRLDQPLAPCDEPAEFYLGIQPAPHNPIFRRTYLISAIAPPLFPAHRIYDPIAETWFYYHLSIMPARIKYVPGAWTIVGDHLGERISRAWERQAFAALHLMRSFMAACPVSTATVAARQRVGHCAFATWRALPYNFTGFPADDFIAIWRTAPRVPLTELGGRWFQRLARVVGPVPAARIFRRLQRGPYSRIRTLSSAQLAVLVHE